MSAERQPPRRRRYARPGEPGYGAALQRVRRQRGAPAEHACGDCGQPACQWSYDNADPREFTDRATGRSYSTDPQHYRPRCGTCQRRAAVARGQFGHRIPLDQQECLRLYRQGTSVRALGKIFGYPAAQIRALLVDQGEQLDRHQTRSAQRRRDAEHWQGLRHRVSDQ